MNTRILSDDFIDEAQVRFARSTTKELEAQIAACRPRRGQPPKKGQRPNPFRVVGRDPLEL